MVLAVTANCGRLNPKCRISPYTGRKNKEGRHKEASTAYNSAYAK